jgi:arylsulfatase A-like enzyme
MFRCRSLPLTVCLAALLAAEPTRAEGAEPVKPNIVLILIDDLGWTDLGCYGSNFYETPNLDRLAKQGVRFTNGYAACPVCSPTRASLLTGRSPARLHLTDWLPGRTDRPSQKLLRPQFHQHLPLDELTLAEALKPAGYVSASIGKWHLGGDMFLPEKQGFDRNIGGTHAGSPPGGYFSFKTPTLALRDKEYLTDRLTEEAERFIEANQDRPFFLYLTHYAVHIPLQAKADLIAKYQAKALQGRDGPHDNPVSAAMIHSMDESVGRVLRKLDEQKLTGRTLVIFTSDNGGLSVKEGPHTPATSNHPLRAGKGYLYEGGIRVPWIIAGAGVTNPGRTCDTPISSIDLYPTVLELAGVKPAADRVIDGVSLVPLLKQTGEPRREALYWHYPHYSNQGGTPGGAVRAGDWKLIEFYEDMHVELYNLKADIGEKHDLAAKQPAKAAELRRLLADWRKAVNAQMPTPNPDYKPAGK